MNEPQNIDRHNIDSALREIEDAFFDIPFGNTDFQCENFVIAASITPARAYRTIGMQMLSLITTLRDAKETQLRRQIDIDEIQERLADASLDKFERRRKELDLERLQSVSRWEEKMVIDTIRQLNLYYRHFKSLPRYTREEFEAGERLYFEQSQRRMVLGITGAKESLVNMIDDARTMQAFEQAWASIPEDRRQELLDQVTRQTMAGMIEFNKE